MKKFIPKLIIILGVFLLFSAEVKAANISASRATDGDTCVAPCSVFFEDLDGTIDSATAGEIKPFHDYHYAWDFGDPGSGYWGTTGKTKNKATGAVAAHVYDRAGEHVVNLEVYDSFSKELVGSDQVVVTITDPDQVFSGSKTTCISDTTHNDFVGCPDGANQISTDDISSIGEYADAGERILFHRGSSWTISNNISWPVNDGPVSIGAFAECLSPDEMGICNNAPLITVADSATKFLELDRKNNWRLSDITFAPSGATNKAVASGVMNIKNILLYRLSASGFGTAYWWGLYRQSEFDYPENNAVVSCHSKTSYGMAFYAGAERLIALGNNIQESAGHVARIWQAYKAVISHNIFAGSSFSSEVPGYQAGTNAVKFHAPSNDQIGSYANLGNASLRYGTKYAVFSDNIIGSSGPWPLVIGPTDAQKYQDLSDIVIEKNKIIADYGSEGTSPPQLGMRVSGRYHSIRNNIIDGSGVTDRSYSGISIEPRGVELPPANIQVYNNTVYSGEDSTGNFYGYYIDQSATNIVLKNNIASFPMETSDNLFKDDSGLAEIDFNFLSDAPHFIDSENMLPLSRDFNLSENSEDLINNGTDVPVYDDFLGNKRIGTYDLGAYNYNSDEPVAVVRFDVDQNGAINTSDAILTLRESLDLDMSATAWQASVTTGDVNCDGGITSADALLLLRHSLGLQMGETSWCE